VLEAQESELSLEIVVAERRIAAAGTKNMKRYSMAK
jgi:hypothetical protein